MSLNSLKITVSVLCFVTAIQAFPISKKLRSQAHSIVGHIVNCEFDSALSSSDSVIKHGSHEPLGYVMKLMTVGLRDLDYDMIIDSSLFEETYKTCMEVLDRHEGKKNPDSYYLTMRGFANASYATYHLRQEKYIAAMSTGLDAMRDLKKAKKLDPQNYDADFFLGLYEYAKSELKKKLWMVLFWYSGDKAEGIRRLENAASKGKFVSDAAKMALIDIYTEEKRYPEAVEVIRSLLARFPSSRFVLWSKARYHESQKEHKSAADAYEILAQSYATYPQGRHNTIVTRMHQLDHLQLSGDREKELKTVRYISTDLCDGDQKNKHDLCERAKKIEKELMIETSN